MPRTDASPPPSQSVADRMLEWVTTTRAPEPAAIRRALLQTLSEPPLLLGLLSFWAQSTAMLALFITGSWWWLAWTFADGFFALSRWRLQPRVSDTAVNVTSRSAGPLLAVIAGQCAAMALGAYVAMLDGDLCLLALGAGVTIGFGGYAASRFAGCPRYANTLLCGYALALVLGLAGSPHVEVTLIGAWVPAMALPFSLFTWLNHRALLEALRAQQESRRLSMHDALTELPNRLHLHERLDALCGPARHHDAAAPFAVLWLDLDGFKQINDRHGHSAGDWLLKATADRLRRTVRDSDFVARIGGDEFVVILRPADRDAAVGVAGQIIAACARPLDVGAVAKVAVHASIGIALAPHDRPADAESLLRQADVALYAAKNDGRGTWRLAPAAQESETCEPKAGEPATASDAAGNVERLARGARPAIATATPSTGDADMAEEAR